MPKVVADIEEPTIVEIEGKEALEAEGKLCVNCIASMLFSPIMMAQGPKANWYLSPCRLITHPTKFHAFASIAGVFGASWRIVLFRAVRDNDIELVKKVCSSHPVAIHEHFTSGMKEWELSWDSLRWYEFGDSTALYVASAYCSDKVVRWLLENGVDPDAVCYSKQVSVPHPCSVHSSSRSRDELRGKISRGRMFLPLTFLYIFSLFPPRCITTATFLSF